MKATRVLAILLLLGGTVLLSTTGTTGAAKALPDQRSPLLSTPAGTDCTPPLALQSESLCYPPQDKVVAERLFAVRPLDPTRVVKRLTRLPLSQVSTNQEYDENGHLRPRAWGLAYDFGSPPSDQVVPTATPIATPSATPASTTPPATWAAVGEESPQTHYKQLKLKGMHVARRPSADGPFWQLDEVLHVHYHVLVHVLTNGSRTLVVQIGTALRKQDKRG